MIETQANQNTNTAEQAELKAVLSSDALRRAPTLARILEYLCERQLRGESFIKEYEIATQVMGRSSDFDPQQDGSVRVNLHHLRKKLKTFYEVEGAAHTIWITLPIGQSLPSFIPQPSPTTEAQQTADNIDSSTSQVSAGSETTRDLLPSSIDEPASTASRSVADGPETEPTHAVAERRKKPRRALALPALLAVALVTAAVVFFIAWFWMRGPTTRPTPAGITDATLRIACGAQHAFQDNAGRTWSADAGFQGGRSFHRSVAVIAGTSDPGMYQNGRVGDFSYDIPLPRAAYELHLYFAETEVHGEGFRAMQIWLNGKPMQQHFDVTSDSGGFASATEQVYTGVQPGADGKLHLRFKKESGEQAFVNAIEVMPGNGDAIRPIRQTTMPIYYFDPQGTVWTPDAWFHGGRVNHIPDLFPGLPVQGFYQNERFGNFSYSIPVARDRTYSLTLYFQDAWFSHHRRSTVGAGQRRFDVSCNGKTLLQQFDILQETSNGNFQVVRHFTGIEPTSSGKIMLTFTPSQNYALLNAFSIEQELVAAAPK